MKPNAHLLFQFYVKQILELFQKAIGQEDPAMFLYRHHARSLLFNAESLVRLVNQLVKDKEVRKSLKIIKKLEDLLGRIDQYDQYIVLFSKNKKIKNPQLDYLRMKRDKLAGKFNERLIKKAYYQKTFNDIISEFTINFNDRLLILKLREIIKKELEECREFFLGKNEFIDMEDDVHELRRRLRWMGIYAQSFRGIVTLKDDRTKYKWEKKFMIGKEKKSPYNTLQEKKDLAQHIVFNKKAFLATSHVIAELGKIKDEAFAMQLAEKAIKKTSGGRVDAEKKAQRIVKSKHDEKELLKAAYEIADDYFKKFKIDELLIL